MSDPILQGKPPQSRVPPPYSRTNPPDWGTRQAMMSQSELNELIAILVAANLETPNERILVAINMLRNTKDRNRAQALDLEPLWEELEFIEFARHIDDYPHSVRTWLLEYRAKDIE